MRSWVDVHVHRASIRLGLIGKKVTADAVHTLLQALLPQDTRSIYNFHKALLRHGQSICVYEHPQSLSERDGQTPSLDQPVSAISHHHSLTSTFRFQSDDTSVFVGCA